jgi:drug/metabolite transporter (DMT)-like permease
MARFTRSRPFGFLLLTLTMVGWGLSFSMNRWLLRATPLADEPWGGMSLSVLRFAVAAPVLVVWAAVIVRRHGGLPLREWGELALLGALSVLGYHLLANSAQTYGSGSLNAVLHQMIPVIAFVGGLVFLRERLTLLKIAGVAVASAGAAWYSMAESEEALAGDNILLTALLVGLVAVDWTIYMILVKRALRRWSAVELTVLVNALGAAMLLVVGEALRPVGCGVDWRILGGLSFEGWAVLLYVALAAGIVCYLTYNAGLQLVEASRAAVFEYLLVPVTMAAGALLPGELHETPSAAKIVSAAVIIAGVYLVTWQRKVGDAGAIADVV